MSIVENRTRKKGAEDNSVMLMSADMMVVNQFDDLVNEFLIRLGEDPQREGLLRTPERVTRMMPEVLGGYQMNLNCLINDAIFHSDSKDLVMVRDIQYYSFCEHHLLPFFGKAYVAYIPNGKIIGLSKIPRIVEMFARRLQVQENLTKQIGNAIMDVLHPLGVAVVLEGTHLCAVMRGVKQTDANLVTTCMLGLFEQDANLRSDFLQNTH